MTDPASEVWTTAQVAEHFGISRGQVRRTLARRGVQPLPYSRDTGQGGSATLYNADAVRAAPRLRKPKTHKETPMRTWTLSADCPAGRLQVMVQEYFPGQIAPSVTDGAWATVAYLGDPATPPQWMRQLADDYRGTVDTTIE